MAADWLLSMATGLGGATIIAGAKWLLDRQKKDGIDEGNLKLAEARNSGVRDSLESLRSELKNQAEERKEAVEDLRMEMRDGIKELRTVSADMARLQSSQNVVNTMMSKSLEAIGAKQEQHAEKLADHASTIRLLTDNVTMMRQRVDQIDGPTVRQVEREKQQG